MDVNAEEVEGPVRAQEQLDMLAWRVEGLGRDVEGQESAEVTVGRLLQSVTEVRSDYQNLRRELVEVQALQRELSARLRTQLQQVQGKFSSLKERLVGPPPH